MQWRYTDPKKDLEAMKTIWLEVGWYSPGDDKPIQTIIDARRGILAELNGKPECQVISDRGTMQYLNEILPFSCVTAVTTSLVARKQGIASKLTARRIALDALDGDLVCGLGIFEQGFYDKLGFGCGGYEHWTVFDPSNMKPLPPHRPPARLTAADWEKIHDNRLRRLRRHGVVDLSVALTRSELEFCEKKGTGYGYYDSDGKLTHHIWVNGIGSEHGPLRVMFIVYETLEQFIELMSLLRSFGEQVHSIRMKEPFDIQLQDFLKRPIYYRNITRKSEHENITTALAYWQMRILDLPGCMAKTHLEAPPLTFNLTLTDPIENYLEPDDKWKGVADNYTVTLGPESSAERGHTKDLPLMTATVNAFTRLWLGVLDPAVLRATDGVSFPDEMLPPLQKLLRLPKPNPDWDF